MPKPITVVVTYTASTEEIHSAVALLNETMLAEVGRDAPPDDKFYVAMDLEGVSLGRKPGTLEIITLAIGSNPSHIFVIDAKCALTTHPGKLFFSVQQKEAKGGRTVFDLDEAIYHILTSLIHDERCVTVMHDCRQDCDAMWHHMGYKPRCVHDTSVAHGVLTGYHGAKLNDTLEHWGEPLNHNRGTVDYNDEPDFWANRPLTRKMVDYARGDVCSLVPMALQQIEVANAKSQLTEVQEKSEVNRDCMLKMGMEWLQCHMKMGEFIGFGGSNVREMSMITGCFFYGKGTQEERKNGFWVYYPNDDSLLLAKFVLGWDVPVCDPSIIFR